MGRDTREVAREYVRNWGRDTREVVRKTNWGGNIDNSGNGNWRAKLSLNEDTAAGTLFICDLPDDMDEIWLSSIFSGAGKIIEVTIPRKRSFRLNQRYGFVKFECKKDGFKTITMWNRACIQGHQLLVKMARFGNARWKSQGRKAEEKKMIYREINKSKEGITGHHGSNKEIGNSASSKETPVVKAGQSKPTIDSNRKRKNPCVKVSEVGNGWLFRSAIAKLSPQRSMVYMQDHLMNLGHSDILVRPIDSNQVVLTFSNTEERNSIFNGGKLSWLKDCFLEIQKWEDTITSQRTRLVWLNCYGIPLHVWNCETFKGIGQVWGEVISISNESLSCVSFTVGKVLIATSHMDSINQEVTLIDKDRSYIIRVSEEQYVINTILRSECQCKGCSKLEVHDVPQMSDEKVDEAGLRRNAVFGDKEGLGEGNNVSTSNTNIPSSGYGFSSRGSGKDKHILNHSTDIEGNEEEPQSSWVANSIAESSSFPRKTSTDNCDVVCPRLKEDESKVINVEEDQMSKPIKATVNSIKGKKKRKTIEDILGFSKVKDRNNKGRKLKQKCVVLRSAVTAAALSASMSSDGIANRNRLILNEAQAVWECNKLMGLDYDGDENEVISRIAEMEERDLVLAGEFTKQANQI